MSEPANPNAVFARRYDLDWLRIIAFGLLIFYHVGRFFDTEPWHAKSLNAGAAIEPVMWLSTPWRLPLLFFISGVAIRFLSDKLGSARFVLDRTWRLFPVLVFAVFVIVPPQTYSEVVSSGAFSGNFFDFYALYAGVLGGPWEVITPTYNHLWYVAYLLIYCLILAPVLPVLRWLADSSALTGIGNWFSRGWGLLALLALPVIPFLIYRFALAPDFPVTHALVDDWYNHAVSLTCLLMGYLAAKNGGFWQGVSRLFPASATLAIILLGGLFWAYSHLDSLAGNAVLLWAARLARVALLWVMIMALSGMAMRFLNHDGPLRRYFTAAIFPYYILHQTIIVVVGFWIRDAGLGPWQEFGVLAGATIIGCGMGYELVRRIPLLRPFMGLKLKSGRKPEPQGMPARA
ncbi:acyltransferase family protein [Hyphobacterium sp. HN65]|uniref:Acyltransferase family protein n=1 Tax=Hyphobacterium lacteum TaxID=3116575 RepID=A0ABU7LSU3_9PROT|nr:acyltransferase family protein [Hyphobacterium sp. HN65]MEE2526711.1 acyltransferase family protein [Hyphobacterium sp. HN65]